MFRSVNNEKIALILNYFASNIQMLSMTKALKLLYILDETSIKEIGSPMTWLDFKVWEMGPVAIDIYNEIKRKEIICHQGKDLSVSGYIDLKVVRKENTEEIYLIPKQVFNDSIFNNYEKDLLYLTVFKFGNWTAKELIDYLHEENSLWYKSVKEHNLEENFFSKGKRTTNYSIEFSELIQDDPILLMANKSSMEALQFQQRLSDYAYE